MIMRADEAAVADPGEDRSPRDCMWIENEGLLRDEGVTFGLSGGEPGLQAKEECIAAFYRQCKAETARLRDGLRDERETLRAAAAPGEPLRAEREATAVSGDAPAALAVRYGVTITASVAACVGAGALVMDQLGAAYGSRALVATGVLAAGFFTTALRVPLLFASDAAAPAEGVELWKARVAELGVPLAAAVFVAAAGAERSGVVRAVATGTLLTLVFAFAGRQLLAGIPPLGRAIRAVRADRAEAARRRTDEIAAARAADVTQRLDAIRRELAALRSDAEWDAVCAVRLALFRSEYELARASSAVGARPVPSRSPSSLLSID